MIKERNTYAIILMLIFFGHAYKCIAQEPEKSIINKSQLKFKRAFDTLVSKGNEVIFFKPTEEEFKLIVSREGKDSGIYEVDSDFTFYANSVSKTLKNSKVKVVFVKQRIIKIIAFDQSISYLDRLGDGGDYYGTVINFDKSEPVVHFGVDTDTGILKFLNQLTENKNDK